MVASSAPALLRGHCLGTLQMGPPDSLKAPLLCACIQKTVKVGVPGSGRCCANGLTTQTAQQPSCDCARPSAQIMPKINKKVGVA